MSKTSIIKSTWILLLPLLMGANSLSAAFAETPENSEGPKDNIPKEATPSKVEKLNESTVKELVKKSEWVGICTAVEVAGSARPGDKVKSVRFRITDIVKGPPYGCTFNVRCRENIPQLGSNWILLIHVFASKNGHLRTTDGDKGRIPATEENTKLIKEIVKSILNERKSI